MKTGPLGKQILQLSFGGTVFLDMNAPPPTKLGMLDFLIVCVCVWFFFFNLFSFSFS